ncbi:MAG: transcriptional repressor [Desulfobacterales bacterium]|nr:transcriptional repressor [Desulfobacterales bacterium]
MKQVHSQEKEQFKKLFKQENVSDFEDRFKVLEVFLQTEHHLTVREIIQLLDKNGYELDRDFVRETLKLICRFGFARKIRFNNEPVRYEHRHLCQHHDHMICTKCKKIIEFQNEKIENLQVEVSHTYGFHMLQHKLEIYGICSECLKDHLKLMPLVMAKQGERLIIQDLTGGSTARMRLLSIGLRIGDEIDVITNSGQGQMVIALDCNRYAIGHELAQKIIVQTIKVLS